MLCCPFGIWGVIAVGYPHPIFEFQPFLSIFLSLIIHMLLLLDTKGRRWLARCCKNVPYFNILIRSFSRKLLNIYKSRSQHRHPTDVYVGSLTMACKGHEEIQTRTADTDVNLSRLFNCTLSTIRSSVEYNRNLKQRAKEIKDKSDLTRHD